MTTAEEMAALLGRPLSEIELELCGVIDEILAKTRTALTERFLLYASQIRALNGDAPL